MKKHTKKLIILIVVLSVSLLQTGCWDQKIYEKIGFMLQLGLELDENGEIRYTTNVPLISPNFKEKTNKDSAEILSTKINLVREGRDKVRLVSGKSVEGGKIQQVFFSESMAKKGINPFLEIFLRSAENPLVSNVVVVEGSPYEMMKFSQDFSEKPRPTFYVNALLQSARKNSYVPEARISHFTILSHSKTIDPTTPLIRYNKNEIQIAGSALFNGDKLVGKINIKDTGLLTGLLKNKSVINYIYQGKYAHKNQDNIKNGIAIYMKTKNPKIKVNVTKNRPVIDIDLDFKGSLSEYSGELDLSNPEDKKKLEDAVAESIQKDYIKLLHYLSEIESDPVGFGEIVRSKYNSYWKSVKWKNEYKYASFNVNTKINFEIYGAVNNP